MQDGNLQDIIKEIENSLAQIREAILDHPDDPDLLEVILQRYRRLLLIFVVLPSHVFFFLLALAGGARAPDFARVVAGT